MAEEAQKSETIEFSFDILRKRWPLLLLILIAVFGFYIRLYHINYPVVGYHNWKETHYLTEARNFERGGFFKYGFFIPEVDYINLDAQDGVHSDTFPTISILAALSFKIFGEKLWAARIISIFFIVGTIIMMYFFVRKLFNREDAAVIAAFLTAICPLFVFFGRMAELVNPGIFFMVTSLYFYICWVEDASIKKNASTKNIVLASLFFALAVLTKYPFAVIAIPMLFIFPWRIFKEWKTELKKHLKGFITSAAFFLAIILWFIYSDIIVAARTSMAKTVDTRLIDFWIIFTSKWWDTLTMYVKDNYTGTGFILSLFGLLFIFMFYRKNKKMGEKFMLGYFIGAVFFVLVMSSKLSGHSYHQYPIAPLVVISLAYFIVVIANNIKKILDVKYANMIVIILLCAMVYYPSTIAADRQFDFVSPGLDVAGEYIKKHSEPNERFFFSGGGQSYGVVWHADRKAYDGHPLSEDMQKAEKKFNYKWVLIYQWGLSDVLNNAKKWDYIKGNYSLRQMGFLQSSQGPQLAYLLMQKGGSFDGDINKALQENKNNIKSEAYGLSSGSITLNYVDVK